MAGARSAGAAAGALAQPIRVLIARTGSVEPREDAIAERIRRREPEAFDEFFRRFAAPLLAYLEGLVRDRATAEDLLQETMVRVFRHIDRYEERGAFRGWVYRAATHLALSELRRRRAARTEPLELHAPALAAPGAHDVEAHDVTAARRRAVEAALAALDEGHRAVVLLRVREEMTVAEIATTLGIPGGTVKSRMHHAVRKIREAMACADAGRSGEGVKR